jgi:adenylate kinase
VILRRLQVYDQQTKPLLDYYGPKLITEIDTSQPPHIVLRDILSAVPPLKR